MSNADLSQGLYLPLVMVRVARMAISSALPGIGHDRVVGSLLRHLSVCLLWTSRAAGSGRHSSATVAFGEYKGLLRQSPDGCCVIIRM